jgi:hypothetical protein
MQQAEIGDLAAAGGRRDALVAACYATTGTARPATSMREGVNDGLEVQVELSSPEQCEGAAQAVAETAARDGALGFEVMGCRFVAQDV